MSVGHRCSLLHPQQARVRCPLQLHLDKLDIRVHTLHLMWDIWKMIYFMIERIWWARLQSQNQMRIFCVLVFSDWGASMRVSGLRFPPHLMFSVRLCILPPRPGPICPNMWEGHTVWDTLGHTLCGTRNSWHFHPSPLSSCHNTHPVPFYLWRWSANMIGRSFHKDILSNCIFASLRM